MKYSFQRLVSLLILTVLSQLTSLGASPDAVLFAEKVDILVKNGKLITNYSYDLLINNRDGEEYCKIKVPFSKMCKLSKLEAEIADMNGNIIRKLKSNEITERSQMQNFSLYEDNYVKEFTLVHNSFPYHLRYRYQHAEESFLEIIDWIPLLEPGVPTLKAELNLEVPKTYPIHVRTQNTLSASVDSTEQSYKYHWETSYTQNSKAEIYAPTERKSLPEIEIVPENFKYDQEGSFKSWITYGNWQAKLIEPLMDLSPTDEERIKNLVSHAPGAKEKIKILYHLLQDETRYINISINTGGLKPYPASYVCQNKYGDCKALTNYMKTILNIVGIPSYYTKVHAGEKSSPVNKDFPSQQFNHAILFVPLANDTIWLDCTSKGPFNHAGTFIQNRDAFVVENNKSHFVKIRPLREQQVNDIRKVQIKTNESNEQEAIFHYRLRGQKFDEIKEINQSDDNMKSLIVRNYIVPDKFNLIDYRILPAHRDSDYIDLEMKTTTKTICRQYGNDFLIQLPGSNLPRLESPAKRTKPVQIDYPIVKTDSIEFEIPAGLKITVAPKSLNIQSKYGSYEVKSICNDKKISLSRRLIVKPAAYSLKEYPDFYNFIESIKTADNTLVYSSQH